MPQRVFSEETREDLRTKMLSVGIPLLREYGMTHMSVEKIAGSAGIGKSTFYNFFPSKEVYICEVMEHNRRMFQNLFHEKLAGRDKMPRNEAEELFRLIITSSESPYQYLTPEDILRLKKMVPEEILPDLTNEKNLLDGLFAHMEGVRENPDFAVIANLMKIIAISTEHRDQLHAEGYETTMDAILCLLFSTIFGEEQRS